MNYTTGKVIHSSAIKIRPRPTMSVSPWGTYQPKETFDILETKRVYPQVADTSRGVSAQVWYKTNKGWVLAFDDKYNYVQKIEDENVKEAVTNEMYDQIGMAIDDTTSSSEVFNKTMQLFGLPYQFLNSVDPRYNTINKYVGRNYINRILNEAPVVTIVPGDPYYLPGQSKDDRLTYTDAFLQAASGTIDQIESLLAESSDGDSSKNDKIRLYDFKSNYFEYIRYVNIMCRACADLLGISNEEYKYIKSRDSSGDAAWSTMDFSNFDWKNYRWNGTGFESLAANGAKVAASYIGEHAESTMKRFINSLKSLGSAAVSGATNVINFASEKITGDDLINTTKKTKSTDQRKMNLSNPDTDDLDEKESVAWETAFRRVNYIQFYTNPDSTGVNEGFINSSTSPGIKSTLEDAATKLKDIEFLTDTAGAGETADTLKQFASDVLSGIGSTLNLDSSGSNNVESVLARITDIGSNFITGANVIMPDIYQSSSYTKSYNISIPLKAIYGNKLSYYMDILVPAIHLLALALPRQNTANTYKSPFLVKIFMDGLFTCNLGLVTDISINKTNVQESRNIDGLYTEWDVALSVTDLYSDLTMTPSNHPLLFLNNSSLIDYLSINCGLNFLEPRLSKKLSLAISGTKNLVEEFIPNVAGKVVEKLDSAVASWTDMWNV